MFLSVMRHVRRAVFFFCPQMICDLAAYSFGDITGDGMGDGIGDTTGDNTDDTTGVCEDSTPRPTALRCIINQCVASANVSILIGCDLFCLQNTIS